MKKNTDRDIDTPHMKTNTTRLIAFSLLLAAVFRGYADRHCGPFLRQQVGEQAALGSPAENYNSHFFS